MTLPNIFGKLYSKEGEAVDWLICQNGRGGRKEILLARDEKSFFVIYVHDGLTHDKRNTLQLQGVSENLLKKLDVHFDKIPKSAIRGVAIGGYSAGDMVYLYPNSGRRMKFQLRVNHEMKQVEDYFENMKRFAPPTDKKEKKRNEEYWRREGRNQQLYESLGIVIPIMVVVSFVVGIMYARTSAWYWFVGCLFCVMLPLVLVILLPQYFTLIMAARGKKSDALEASWIFFGVVLWLAVMPAKNWLDAQTWLIAALLCGGICTLLLGLLAEEFRKKKEYLFAVFFISAIVGVSLVGHANEVFDYGEPESYILKVEELDYWRGGRRNRSKHYECSVILPDGREAEMDISKEFYDRLKVGDLIRVELSEGALGIEYTNAYPIE